MSPFRRKKRDGSLGATYYVSYWKSGRHFIKSLGTDNIKEAKARVRDLQESLSGRRGLLATIVGALDAFPDAAEDDLLTVAKEVDARIRRLHPAAEVTLEDGLKELTSSRQNLRRWKRFMEWLPREKLFLREVTTDECRDFIDGLIKSGRSDAEVFSSLSCLKRVFRRLHARAGLKESPVANIERPKMASYTREAFSLPQVRMLVEKADDDLREAILLAASTGLRLADLTNLRWSDVTEEGGRVVVATLQRKTKKPVRIPLSDGPSQWLRGMPRLGPYVLQSLAGKRPNEMCRRFSKVMVACGIQANAKVPGRLKARKIFGWHSLRHFYGTYLAGQNLSGPLLMQSLGHTKFSTTERYINHNNEARDALVAGAAPDLFNTPKQLEAAQ